jgi:hypothetical protein
MEAAPPSATTSVVNRRLSTKLVGAVGTKRSLPTSVVEQPRAGYSVRRLRLEDLETLAVIAQVKDARLRAYLQLFGSCSLLGGEGCMWRCILGRCSRPWQQSVVDSLFVYAPFVRCACPNDEAE